MPPQEFAFAAPRTEELTRVAVIGIGAGVTGGVQGVMVKMAPQLGTLEPLFTWGTLLGIPAIGVAGALFSRGMISDLFLGVAAGGAAIIGYSLPEIMAPITGRRAGAGQLGAGPGVKQLMAGPMGAPQRAQQSVARVGLEF